MYYCSNSGCSNYTFFGTYDASASNLTYQVGAWPACLSASLHEYAKVSNKKALACLFDLPLLAPCMPSTSSAGFFKWGYLLFLLEMDRCGVV
jgi:hypothetical protein